MNWKVESRKLVLIAAVFAICFWLPVDWARFTGAIMEALQLVRWYAREHVLLCLVPAFFIAGAIGVFVSQAAVMKYLGPRANKVLAYGVASVSGTILAVCSCTVLPLFAGIYRMGAGLGPACAFLYSGPAINVLAIVLTARILGLELGIARAVGAISFSVVIGLAMHFIYRREETEKADLQMAMPEPEVKRPLWQNAVFFALMVGILVFANWGAPNAFRFSLRDGREFTAAVVSAPEHPAAPGAAFTLNRLDLDHEASPADRQIVVATEDVVARSPLPGVWTTLWQSKWTITALLAILFGAVLALWFGIPWWQIGVAAAPVAILAVAVPSGGLWVLLPFFAGVIGLSAITARKEGESGEWFAATWGFAKQILPLLFMGVVVAGFLLGRPGHEGMIPGRFVEMLVGDSPDRFFEITGLGGGAAAGAIRTAWPVWTNFFASIFGAFMYFATLTEVPILQGLIGAGMGKGPALALLLAGPALSLPSMLVIRSIMGTKKTVVFICLVVVMATLSGIIYGALF
jgi:hypothetical protein